MLKSRSWSFLIIKYGLLLLAGISMSACAGLFDFEGERWKEEVLLHDGSTIVVERSQSRGGRGEIGQSPIKEQSIAFTFPGSRNEIIWRDEYSEEAGHANFNVLALHILNGKAYVVASAYGCPSYNKWGRPNPPYIFFRYDGKAWARIPLSEFPADFKQINLVINSSAHVRALIEDTGNSGFVSSAGVRRFNSSLKQPEFKIIIREPLLPTELCPRYSSGPKAPNPIGPFSTVK
jgi:hypothetical protein